MRSMIVGTMLAAGLLAARAVRAEEGETATRAASTAQVAEAKSPAYGARVNGDVTTDADGIPVEKPNPMSRFLDQAKGAPPVDMPLVDPPPPDASETDTTTR